MITSPIPKLFAHFFDIHFLEEKGVQRFQDQALGEARLAMRFAVMLAEEVIVPASSFIESAICRKVLSDFDPDVFADQITLTAGGANLGEFIEDKTAQYTATQSQGIAYRAKDLIVPFPWLPRRRSSTADIITDWRQDLSSGRTEDLFRSLHGHLPPDHLKRWMELPERLGGAAFVVDNIIPHLLATSKTTIVVRNRLHAVVNRSYFGSYAKDTGAAVFRKMRFLESPEPVPSGAPDYDVDFASLSRSCRASGILKEIVQTLPPRLPELRLDERFASAYANSIAQSTMDVSPRRRLWAGALIDEVSLNGAKRSKAKILIVTALPKEAAAVRATFDQVSDSFSVRDDPFSYIEGTYTFGGHNRTVLATLSAMGNQNAATAVANALRTHKQIKHILMVGIAGGCPNPDKPNEHVRLGDVVVSSKGIFDYGHVKRTPTGDELRATPQMASHKLLQGVSSLETQALLGRRPWVDCLTAALGREQLDQSFLRPHDDKDVLRNGHEIVPHPPDPMRRAQEPRVHGGVIAAGDILNKDARQRDYLRDRHGVRALEMEGVGVWTAAWACDREVIAIRGVCDYCDEHKNDDWQQHAALAAAAYARALIEVLPEEWFA